MISFKRMAPVILSILVFSSCGGGDNGRTEADVSQEDENTSDSLVLAIRGVEGKSVLEVTETEHNVDYVASSMGAFVKGIDSIYGEDGYAWFVSVNDSMIQTAADKYITADSDIVKWHFREL